MFLDVLKLGGGMLLVVGVVIILWVIADYITERKFDLSERLRALEEKKSYNDPTEIRSERERQDAEKRKIEAIKAEYRRQSEISAMRDAGDLLNEELKRLINGT